jgi:hypothetical protein
MDVQLVKNLDQKAMQYYLVVVSVKNDFANQIVAMLARVADHLSSGH